MQVAVRSAKTKQGIRITGDEVLLSGSIIHWDERGPDPHQAQLTCGGCGSKRLAFIPYRKYRQNPTAGFCFKCDKGRRRRLDEVNHPSGAVVHWAIREDGNRQKVCITCVRCGDKKFVKAETARDPEWSGRCFECFQAEGGANPTRLLQDEMVAFGSIIHWSEWKEGRRRSVQGARRVPVTCGICVAKEEPKTKRVVSRSNIPPNEVRHSPDYMLFCRSHSRAEVAVHITRFKYGDGQKNEGAEKQGQKHGPGRRPKPAKTKYEEARELLSGIVNELVALKKQKVGRSVATANCVASRLNIGDRTGGDAMMKKLERGGIKIYWITLRDGLWDDSTEIHEFLSSHSTEIPRN